MSTATPQSDATAPAPPADEVFDRLVWRNGEICANCFTRCKRITVIDGYRWGQGMSARPTAYHDRTPQGTIGYDDTEHDDHGALRTHQPATTCAECGSVRLLSQGQDLTQREAVELCDPLATRLEEQGVAVSTTAMKRLVGKVKSMTDAQGYDREIFARAVKLGVKHADGPRP